MDRNATGCFGTVRIVEVDTVADLLQILFGVCEKTTIFVFKGMVTDQYSHILDDDRRTNAALIEEAFYRGKNLVPGEGNAGQEKGACAEQQQSVLDPELLAKILANPEMAALINALVKSLN